uniref:Uncharacterized protein TCIL3000_11_13870 n=1 Tax=Trypanosoma congolense (strain IL3000) TaxID=1068625 RepID=G0V2K9_TRYCI|nr:unnamed protein product [Trypanosoma congolense IL3000]
MPFKIAPQMFSRDEVDSLFSDALRVSQRSLLLLNERSRGAVHQQQPRSQPSSSATSSAFTVTVQELRSLADFNTFVEAAGEVCERIRHEGGRPSSAMQRKRLSGSAYPLLSRLVEGLAGVRSASHTGAEELWSDGVALMLLLFRAGLFIDWLHGAEKAMSAYSTLFNSMADTLEILSLEDLSREIGSLLPLLCKVREGVPEELVEEFEAEVVRVACLFPLPSTGAESIASLSSMLLFPALIPYTALYARHRLAATNIIAPVDRIAAGLSQVYLREGTSNFHQACRALVQHTVLVGACVEVGSLVAGKQREGVGFLKHLLDAMLVPIERAFSNVAAPSAGMAEVFYRSFANPLQVLTQSLVKCESIALSAAPPAALGRHTFSNVWCTASYRGLLVVESLAHSELGVANGCRNTTSQQKRYNAMLQQSRGKMTIALLSAVTEDRQLLFEETAARSSQGHKVFRIHGGESVAAAAAPLSGGGGPTVFVFIDSGTVYMKVGRERSFRRANSVEDVFRIFSS